MKNIQEEETKNKIRKEYFAEFDWTRQIGKIDFTISSEPRIGEPQVNYLWVETKQGTRKDIYESFIQLILTIGKSRIYEQEMPPYFLGAADAEKIAFVEYNKVMHIFAKTDFNWNVTPSDHKTKEFTELYKLLKDDLANDIVLFKYVYDDKLIRSFIRKNFKEGRTGVRKQEVGKNNFTFVYYDWVKTVKDTIAVDWQLMQRAGVLDCDFFLADLMSKDGMTIKDKLKVVLEKTKYKVLVKVDVGGIFGDAYQEFQFKDGQKAYNQFWNRYERPPKTIYQRHILERRDLLVPQDIREIKGSYYTPERWVRLSQEYLAKALGEDWQDEYYVWDCAAGSGNLLRGLTNRYNVYASTLDDSDVKVMHDAIDGGRLNLVKNNVFQFDFLNDGYIEKDGQIISDLQNCEKIPESLRKIIADPEKRKKLVIYINPPYKDLTTSSDTSGASLTHDAYLRVLSVANRELFGQFLARILFEIPGCYIGIFSKLKILQGPDFSTFRTYFKPIIREIFLVPANTFDNVVGEFPIAFQIYNLDGYCPFVSYEADVFDKTGNPLSKKNIVCPDKLVYISKWITKFNDKTQSHIGWNEGATRNDFQSLRQLCILASKSKNNSQPRGVWVTPSNLMQVVVSYACRKIVEPTWLNDRDQFLAPKDSWAGDIVFQTDCLIWSIFNNTVHEENGICHWIPFYEDKVNAPGSFNSRFMADFLHGKVERKAKVEATGDMFAQQEAKEAAMAIPIDHLSNEANAVLVAGKEIWKYYMSKPGIRVNASFLDIRAFFQGYKTTENGKRMMNSTSGDERYTELLANLRAKIRTLEARIEPKIYEHGFLLK